MRQSIFSTSIKHYNSYESHTTMPELQIRYDNFILQLNFKKKHFMIMILKILARPIKRNNYIQKYYI